MIRLLASVTILLLLAACEPSGPADTDGGPKGENTADTGEDPGSSDDTEPGILLDPEQASAWPIMHQIRLDVPTPVFPYPGAIMRNVITLEDVPADVQYADAHCHEPKGLLVDFSWQGVHGGAFATVFGSEPTFTLTLPPNPLRVTRYDLCVTTDTDPVTKCTGGADDEMYAISPPRSHFAPPDGLPDRFYLQDFSWQIRACRGSPSAVCGEWSESIPMAWGFAGPIPLREETFTLADGSVGLNLHYCGVEKYGAAASGTDHIICMTKSQNHTNNPALPCQVQYKTGITQGSIHWFLLSSNSPEENVSASEIPDGDISWTVGACNSNVADKFCSWAQVPPRIFTPPF